jgi:hypothetical protein
MKSKIFRCGLVAVVMAVISFLLFSPWSVSRFFWTDSIEVSGFVLRQNGHPVTRTVVVVDLVYLDKAGRCVGVSRRLRDTTSGNGSWSVFDRVAPHAAAVEVHVTDVLGETILHADKPVGNNALTLPGGASDVKFSLQPQTSGIRQDCAGRLRSQTVYVEDLTRLGGGSG